MSNGFWHYLGSFMFYTLAVIGLLYGIYWYIKKNGTPAFPGLQSAKKSLLSSAGSQVALAIESRLPLEARKNLYVVRAGSERFLISTSMEQTQFLAKLDPADPLPEGVSELPQDTGNFAPADASAESPQIDALPDWVARLQPVVEKLSGLCRRLNTASAIKNT